MNLRKKSKALAKSMWNLGRGTRLVMGLGPLESTLDLDPVEKASRLEVFWVE